MLCGFAMPSPVPIGEPSGITAAQPTSSSRRASTGSSVVYGSTTNPSSTSCSAALTNSMASGQQGALVGDHLELDPVGLQRLARQLRGEHRLGGASAARGVRQRGDAQPVQQVQHTGAALGVDAAHRHGGQLGARRDQRLLEHREVGRTAGAQDQPRAELAAGDRELGINHPAPPSPPRPARRRRASSPTRDRGSTDQSTATAMPFSGNPSRSSSAATVVCSSTSTASSLTVTFIGPHRASH